MLPALNCSISRVAWIVELLEFWQFYEMGVLGAIYFLLGNSTSWQTLWVHHHQVKKNRTRLLPRRRSEATGLASQRHFIKKSVCRGTEFGVKKIKKNFAPSRDRSRNRELLSLLLCQLHHGWQCSLCFIFKAVRSPRKHSLYVRLRGGVFDFTAKSRLCTQQERTRRCSCKHDLRKKNNKNFTHPSETRSRSQAFQFIALPSEAHALPLL